MDRHCERSVGHQKKKIQDRKCLCAQVPMQKKVSSCHQKLHVIKKQKQMIIANSILSRKSPSFVEKKRVTASKSYSGVKKDFSPFTKFNEDQPTEIPNKSSGIELARKNYINNLKSTTRYVGLKIIASKAIKNKMIFTINVKNGDTVRKALTKRGWIEKISPNISEPMKYNIPISKFDETLGRQLLSDLVNEYSSNFIWDSKENSYRDGLETDSTTNCHPTIVTANPNSIKSDPIRNHLNAETSWTTKQGLRQCKETSNLELNIPKIYMNDRDHEYNDFLLDYKITACTSFLKWVLKKVANKVAIFSDTGNISTNVIIFAINRCKEYLFMKQNNGVYNKIYANTTPGQWNSFINKYFELIAGEDVFHTEKDEKLPLFIGYAKLLLLRICKYRPLISSEGHHNIWILKPGNGCLGKGIKMASNLNAITDWMLSNGSSKYVVQKYIEEPMLVHGTKFVVRQHYLVTSTNPLEVWMYRDCYLKFSSQKYSLEAFHESIHLTNFAVQKKYKNHPNRHSEIPKHHMWSLKSYKNYLVKHGHEKVWDHLIYPGMRDTIVGTMLGSENSLHSSKKKFGLYGCDFILDKDYRPWLIDISSCCNPKATTEVTAQFYPDIVQDLLRVLMDRDRNLKADTGKFECVYTRPTTLQETKTHVSLSSSELIATISSSGLQQNRQTNLMFSKSKPLFNSALTIAQKAAFDSKDMDQQIRDPIVDVNKDTDTYVHKIESKDSIRTSASEQVVQMNSDQSNSNCSKRSKNSNVVLLTSSKLLKKAHFAGTQFARLLLSYFLIHLQSITGISTLPNVILESQRLRDSLCSQMSSPSKFFATTGHDAETLV